MDFLDTNEVKYSYTLSSGPGGQHVNKVETAVQLRFNIEKSKSIPENIKSKLLERLKHRLTKAGDIVILSQTHRSQLRNKEDALKRLIKLLTNALIDPVVRKPSKPSRSAIRQGKKDKSYQSEKKKNRKIPKNFDD